MFSSISHEFRTPLNSFKNAIEMCMAIEKKELADPRNKDVNDHFDNNLRIASISSRILSSLVEDILDFAKIEAGIFSLNTGHFKIGDLLSDIKYIFQYQ
mmetsp:Transcript_34736/g.34387  ORF Transcript_34736/g.34387 Transcript_34736/m.34387 type:complete len:99 (+) Transcript_34736:642-938(+)